MLKITLSVGENYPGDLFKSIFSVEFRLPFRFRYNRTTPIIVVVICSHEKVYEVTLVAF